MRRHWSAILLLLASPRVFAESPQVSVEPSSLVLGTGKKISVAVRMPRRNLKLRIASNAGTVLGSGDPSSQGRHFTWTPPNIRFPMTALLVFWIEEDSSPPELSMVKIPLSGRTALEINTEPEAEVSVQVANATFGPRRADRRGRAEIPLEVPPGVQTAQVVAEAHGRVSTRAAPLEIPHSSGLAMALSPDPVILGEPCWLVVAHPGPMDAKHLDVQLAGGRLAVESTGPGQALFRVWPDGESKELRARASLRGESLELAEAVARIAPSGEGTSALLAGRRFSASASAGGFYAGGANSGAAVAIDGSYALAAAGRFALDLELGFRSASLSAPVSGLGTVHSTISAWSIEAALRALLFERGAWAIHARVGGGALPFRVSAQSDFQPRFAQSGFAVEGFAAAQLGYRVRRVEFFTELRGGIAPAKTSTIDAQLGGFLMTLGARYHLR